MVCDFFFQVKNGSRCEKVWPNWETMFIYDKKANPMSGKGTSSKAVYVKFQSAFYLNFF